PASYVANDSNLWQMDTIYLTSGGVSYIFAVATPNLFDITSAAEGTVYYGNPLDTDPLVPVPLAAFTASISGDHMTVTDFSTGALQVGSPIDGAGVTAGTVVTEILV